MALNILTGGVAIPASGPGVRLDEEERALLEAFHEVKTQGFGEVRCSIVASHLDTVYTTHVRKRKDFQHPPR